VLPMVCPQGDQASPRKLSRVRRVAIQSAQAGRPSADLLRTRSVPMTRLDDAIARARLEHGRFTFIAERARHIQRTAVTSSVMPTDTLTTEQVAALAGIDASTVRSYKTRKQMPAPAGQMGRTPYWDADVIEAWIEKRKHTLDEDDDEASP
jgi:predicted DNA-binding transcriptional regulator AlpA